MTFESQFLDNTNHKDGCFSISKVCLPIERLSFYYDGSSCISVCKLPNGSPQELQDALLHAPHFSSVYHFATPLYGKPLRLILLSESTDLSRQAAAYLSGIRLNHTQSGSHDWDELDECLGFQRTSHYNKAANSDDVLVLGSMDLFSESLTEESILLKSAKDQEKLLLTQRYSQSPYLLFESSSGTLLTQEFINYLSTCKNEALFVTLNHKQYNRDLMRQLCFEQGFVVCRLDSPTAQYQEAVFRTVCSQKRISLSEKLDFPVILAHLKKMRGSRFSSYDYVHLLDHAAAKYGSRTIFDTHHLIYSDGLEDGNTSLKKIDALIGLDNVKRTIHQLIADAGLSSKRSAAGFNDTLRYRNLAFSGPPGTCKSLIARLLAQALQECGVGSGTFIEAGRELLVGKYLGHTSPMIAQLFEKAAGGVLFIDEAGALISDSHDHFAAEAINALVRHMELHPETIVVFATYPQEMDQLLSSNPGLSSRIARVLKFNSYDENTLCEILDYLADKAGYILPPNWAAVCGEFFSTMRQRQGKLFGNGREARRLLDAAIGNLAVRVADGATDLQRLSFDDLTRAINTLLSEGQQEPLRIGF